LARIRPSSVAVAALVLGALLAVRAGEPDLAIALSSAAAALLLVSALLDSRV
jgi:hypothetical protein